MSDTFGGISGFQPYAFALRTTCRVGTAEQWAAVAGTEILATGELGFDSTNKLLKIGDGITPWGSLAVPASWLGAASAADIIAGISTVVAATPKALEESGRLPVVAGKTAADEIGGSTGETTALKISNLAVNASTTQKGVVELSTPTEFIAGTDASKVPSVFTVATSFSRQAHRFSRMLGHKLKSAIQPIIIGIIGDSTSNESWEWFYLVAQWLASKFPAYTFIHRLWSDTIQSYSGDMDVIQFGTAGDGYAEFSGGRVEIADRVSLRLTGDLEIIAKIACSDYKLGSQTIVSKFGASGNYGYNLFVNTSGYLGFWISPDGIVSNLVKLSTEPIPVIDGADIWVKCVFDADNGAASSAVDFYTSSNGVLWVKLGETVLYNEIVSIYPSTSNLHIGVRGNSEPFFGKIYRVVIKNGINGTVVASPDFGQAHPSIITSFSDLEGNTITKVGTVNWGLGAPCVILANASVPGKTAAYFNDTTRFALVTAHETDLQFINLSHNESTTIDYIDIKTLVSSIIAKYPNTGMVLCAQNPQQAPEINIIPHAIRCGQIVQYAAIMDYGLIDAFAAFRALGDFSAYMTDGCHPNAAGTLLWAEEVEKFLSGVL